MRPITPVINGVNSYAVAWASKRYDGNPFAIRAKMADFGMTHENGYIITVIIELINKKLIKTSSEILTKRPKKSFVSWSLNGSSSTDCDLYCSFKYHLISISQCRWKFKLLLHFRIYSMTIAKCPTKFIVQMII